MLRSCPARSGLCDPAPGNAARAPDPDSGAGPADAASPVAGPGFGWLPGRWSRPSAVGVMPPCFLPFDAVGGGTVFKAQVPTAARRGLETVGVCAALLCPVTCAHPPPPPRSGLAALQ